MRPARPRTTLRTTRSSNSVRWLPAGGALLVAAALLLPAQAPAEGAVPGPAAAPQIHPPVLLEAGEATYPPAARAQGLEAEVDLLLTIDETGAVTAAEVLAPAGHGFDEAAQEAARAFRFQPARRGEAPMPSRIRHRVAFRLPPPPPPAPASAPAATGDEIEVVVRDVTPADRLRRSARAVQVVETEQAQREAADLGEVLARSEGVSVRRSGGLGGRSQFALNGLSGERVRFFLDGVPLELAGYPFGVANVPVNLVDRVEIYRGVVPVAFGADALGGAVNLVSEPVAYGTGGSASYQIGSFGTHRATAGARHLDAETGFYARADGFFDTARNDYEIDVQPWDDQGRVYDATVERKHGAYQAWGIGVETGLVDRSFADRLALRAFYTDQDRELQHNQTMSMPFGAVTTARQSAGGSLRWEAPLGAGFRADVIGGYAFNRYGLLDAVACQFDWYGNCPDQQRRKEGGELNPFLAYDQAIDQHALYARTQLGVDLHRDHELRLAVAPTWTTRDGRNEAVSPEQDPIRGARNILALVSGLEYEARLLRDDLSNIVFVKHYLQTVEAEANDIVRYGQDRTTSRFGVGDSLRYRIARPLYAKASWELATRLPTPDEIFGNGDLIQQNLALEPEVSHNLNLGLTLERVRSPIGGLRLDVNGFARLTDNLIVQVAKENFVVHENVLSATSIGVEAAAGWMLPGDFLELTANATWQDFRNTSSEGPYRPYEGDRIPNTPWLFANVAARSRIEGLVAADDALSLAWITRWIGAFNTGWEGISSGSRLTIPAQLLHTAHLGYARDLDGRLATLGVEVDNVTNRKNYDFFGVQRPGRALFTKLTLEL